METHTDSHFYFALFLKIWAAWMKHMLPSLSKVLFWPLHFCCFRLIFFLMSLWTLFLLSSHHSQLLPCTQSNKLNKLQRVVQGMLCWLFLPWVLPLRLHTGCPTFLLKVVGAVCSPKWIPADTTQGCSKYENTTQGFVVKIVVNDFK